MLTTLMMMLLNVQFGYLAIVLSLPVYEWLQPARSPRARVAMLLLLMVRQPLLVAFLFAGVLEIGFGRWVLSVGLATYEWRAWFWPYFSLVYLPVFVLCRRVVFSRAPLATRRPAAAAASARGASLAS